MPYTAHPSPTNQATNSSRTRDTTASSLITPPRGTSFGPASNCGFNSTTPSVPAANRPATLGSTFRNEMNERSAQKNEIDD